MESVKPYAPKPDKVKKLAKVYADLKKKQPKANPLFKGIAKVIFLAAFFSSCSAQWHVKQALKKDPNIITEKIIVEKDTLIIRDSVRYNETLVTRSIDTIKIENEHVSTIVYRYFDTFRVVQTLKGDTVRITQKVVTPVVEAKPSYWGWIVAGLILVIWIIKK